MTWKHGKFEDSVVLRSLEKVAQSKGLIKPEIVKEAFHKEADLSPTANLTINILKLCQGLRSSGLESEATELEDKYFFYKKANGLYDVSKEEGEDLVDAAHPEGSHKLENVDGDSLVETIIDKHLKMLDLAKKPPTGKSANIINSARIILAQADLYGESIKSLDAQITYMMDKFKNIISIVYAKTKDELTFSFPVSDLNRLANNPTKDNLKALDAKFNSAYNRLKPGIIAGMTEDTWEVLSGLMDQGFGYIKSAIILKTKINELKSKSLIQEQTGTGTSTPAPAAAPVSSDESSKIKEINSKFDTIANKLPTWKAVINGKNIDAAAKTKLIQWLDNSIAKINNYKLQFANQLAAAPDPADSQDKMIRIIPYFESVVASVVQSANNFYDKYVVAEVK